MNDNTIGAMVVCDSSEQAKMLYEIFQSKYAEKSIYDGLLIAAEPSESYGEQKKNESKVKTAAVILHDIGTKEERKNQVADFKEGKISNPL